MYTKDRLAEELVRIGAPDLMVERARGGKYDDFLSDLAMPIYQLCAELVDLGGNAAIALRDRVMNGEFDSSREEAEAWGRSPEGAEALGRLLKRI
jgi:hypothetical protein